MKKMTTTVRPLNLDDLRPETCYLTREDAKSPNDCVRALQEAIDSGSLSAIEDAARDLLNNQRRNDAIIRHEDIITDILDLMTDSLHSGDIFTIESVADAIKYNHPYLCKTDKSGVCAPIGAVTIAIRRMMDKALVKAIIARTECGSFTRVFVMI